MKIIVLCRTRQLLLLLLLLLVVLTSSCYCWHGKDKLSTGVTSRWRGFPPWRRSLNRCSGATSAIVSVTYDDRHCTVTASGTQFHMRSTILANVSGSSPILSLSRRMRSYGPRPTRRRLDGHSVVKSETRIRRWNFSLRNLHKFNEILIKKINRSF